MIGPIVMTGKVYIRAGDTVHEVEVHFPPGQPVTERSMRVQIAKALRSMPGGELVDALEFFNAALLADKPYRVDEVPESFDYVRDDVQRLALAEWAASHLPVVERVQ